MSTNTESVNNFQSQATQTSFPIREIRVSEDSGKNSSNFCPCTKKNKVIFTILGGGIFVGTITALVMGILFGPLAGLLGFLCGAVVGAALGYAFNATCIQNENQDLSELSKPSSGISNNKNYETQFSPDQQIVLNKMLERSKRIEALKLRGAKFIE
jgi:hypothetical protein